MQLSLTLDVYEGPLDLLFHLIEKNKMDIYNIPISDITAQYLAYLDGMKELDLDIASEFLVMAATLISIKARMLVPKAPKEVSDDELIDILDDDPRKELVEHLLEYKRYKDAAKLLGELEINQQQYYNRPNDADEYTASFVDDTVWNNISTNKLMEAMNNVLKRVDKVKIVNFIQRENITIKDKMFLIMSLLNNKNSILFEDVFEGNISKLEVIITFLALLELIKNKKVAVLQQKSYGKIMIFDYKVINEV